MPIFQAHQRRGVHFGSQDAAFKEYRKKVGEKQREGYQAIPFNDPRYGVPSFDPAIVTPQPKPKPMPNTQPVYALTHVTAFEEADLQRCLKTPGWGLSEKVNGERCLVVF